MSDRNPTRDARARNHEVFTAVIKGYIAAKVLEPIRAQNYDPDAQVSRWTPRTAEYVADVEAATRRVLIDHPDMKLVWDRLVIRQAVEMDAIPTPDEPITIPLADANPVIQKCGRIFLRRELQPERYFRVIKKRREEP